MVSDPSSDTQARGDRLDAWLALTGQTAFTGSVRLPMLSGSMSPALPPQSMLLIDASPPATFRRGDVVVYAVGRRLVAHRVLLRLRLPGLDLVLEKGDANPRGRWLRVRHITGVVREATRPDGSGCDPRSPVDAARGLRRHLRACLSRNTRNLNGES